MHLSRAAKLWLAVAAIGVLALAGAWMVVRGLRASSGADSPLPAAQLGGAVSTLAVTRAGRAWLATGQRLQAYDVSDLAEPELLGESPALPEAIRALALAGDTVFAGAGTAGLVIFDGSDPAAPRVIAEIPTDWSVNDVALAGDHAYLAEGAQGVRVLNVRNPADPDVLGQVDTPGDALAVAISGSTLYVADWGTGVRVIDIADSAQPREIAAIDTPGEAADVAVRDDVLYVADRGGGLRVVDVSTPAAPRELASIEIPGDAERVAVSDAASSFPWPQAYVATQDGKLHVVDIRDPARPTITGAFDEVTMAVDVVTAGDQVWVADVATPVAPARDSRADLWSRMHIWGIETQSKSATGLAGVHVAAPEAEGGLKPLGMIFSPSLIESTAVDQAAGLMYMADGHAGILVADIADPARPKLIAVVETPGTAHDVRLAGSHLYVADGPAGLTILDASAPRAPKVVATVDTPGEAYGVAPYPGPDDPVELVYVADANYGVRVIDPAARREVGSAGTPGIAWDVAVAGDKAYVSDRQGGVRVMDLADPTKPREIASALEGVGDVVDVVLDGPRAWVAVGPSGVHALDISDPATPKPLGQVLLEDRAIGVVIDGDRAFIAAGRAGLQELDISDPTNPRQVRAWAMPGAAERLAQVGDWVYVAAELGGMQIVGVDGG